MINVPDIFEPVIEDADSARTEIEHMNLNFYRNGATNLYELAVCVQRDLVQ